MNKRLKNWITIGKTIKNGKQGLLTYLRYLTNNQHKNHLKDSHQIRSFKNYQDIFLNMCVPLEQAHTKQLLKGVGGKPPSKYGHSFTINFPFHFKDKKQEKSAIQSILLKFFTNISNSNDLGMSRDQIIEHIQSNNFYNIHRQDEGSMTQFNFVLSEYIKDIKIDLSKKKFSYLLKNIGIEVARAKGYDINKYAIKTDKPPTKKRTPTNHYKIALQKERLNDYKNKIDYILDDLADNIEKRLNIYIGRMATALEELNEEKFEKNRLLVEKNLNKVISTTKKSSSFSIDI